MEGLKHYISPQINEEINKENTEGDVCRGS